MVRARLYIDREGLPWVKIHSNHNTYQTGLEAIVRQSWGIAGVCDPPASLLLTSCCSFYKLTSLLDGPPCAHNWSASSFASAPAGQSHPVPLMTRTTWQKSSKSRWGLA